jgi:hypothetical protein
MYPVPDVSLAQVVDHLLIRPDIPGIEKRHQSPGVSSFLLILFSFFHKSNNSKQNEQNRKRSRGRFFDHGVGSTDHFSALKIWMFENKFVSLPSHLKTIEPMEVHRGSGTMCNTKTSKVISRTEP